MSGPAKSFVLTAVACPFAVVLIAVLSWLSTVCEQDRDLVPQDQDLRVLDGIAPRQERQPAEHPDHEQRMSMSTDRKSSKPSMLSR